MRSIKIPRMYPAAFLLSTSDKELQRYIQTEVLAGPVSPELFGAIVDAFREHFAARELPNTPEIAEIYLLDDEELTLDAVTYLSVKPVLMSEFVLPNLDDVCVDFGWKMGLLPKTVDRVAVLGVGAGIEVVFLRALLPNASIVVFDYIQGMSDVLIKKLGVKFVGGDFVEEIRRWSDEFDLVYAHHVVEHVFDPDAFLQILVNSLRDEGVLAAALPFEGWILREYFENATQNRANIHPLDLNYLDARHAWKTTPHDIIATLAQCDFQSIEIYMRESRVSRRRPGTLEENFQFEKRSKLLNRCTFGVLRGLLNILFPHRVPRRLARIFFAAERRVWFGLSILRDLAGPEALVLARKL